jgi:hypothetical protein
MSDARETAPKKGALNPQAGHSSPEQLVIPGPADAAAQPNRSARRLRRLEEYDRAHPGGVQLDQVRDRAAPKRAIRRGRAEQTAIIEQDRIQRTSSPQGEPA